MRKTLLMILIIFLFGACNFFDNKDEESSSCQFNIDFQEDDLVGEWSTFSSPLRDTLIIRADGTYKQIIENDLDNFYYESEWQKWHLTYSDDNLGYLHLENMRLCVYWDLLECSQTAGYGREWYDFCQDKWVVLENEGILIVMGPPKGMDYEEIHLVSLKKSTFGVTSYSLKK